MTTGPVTGTGQVGAGTAARAGHENFPVALRVLPRRYRQHLMAVYGYARYVDDLGDEFAGDRESALRAVADSVRRLGAGQPAGDPVVAALAPTVAACGVPTDPLLRLVEANLRDQHVHRYATFDDLVGYCRLSADPVGEIVLHVFGQATPERVQLSNRICTGLQLVEHIQDVGEDRRAGRIYIPQDDLHRFGVAEPDLASPTACPAVCRLVAFETDRALAWLDSGAALVPALRGWARLAVGGYLAGGRAAAGELRRSGHDPLAGPTEPATRRVLAAWLGASLRRVR